MKAAVYYGLDDFRIEERPLPRIGEYEVLVKVRACGVCGTDVHKAVHHTVEDGTILGHEVAGDIIETGREVTKFETGEKVVVPHHTPCFACSYCHHDHHTLCDQYTKTNIDPGGFSEVIRVPQPNVERAMLSFDHIDYEDAAFVEPLACCIHAWDRLVVFPGDTVLIVGAGPIGLLHLELAKTRQTEVLVADIKASRLQQVEKRGGIPLQAREITGLEADIVVVAAGTTNAYELALSSVKKGGQISFFAECPPDSQIALDPNVVYSKELTFTGSYSSTPRGHWKALNLIESGVLDVKQLISHRFGLEDLGRAIKMASRAEDCLKIMIKP
ncbi:MAG: alcohol dehydrogenase catalytic domain-containing protein [Theionarchaea archaeon]|nr:alcohol dehydrogenase catalytic domain-containing protein [Theionarchaea archaeon]MBU7038137.1 alcohol dehydrogenase catalytic domain-containing protein [Theionarchaea archaeon]